MERREFLRKGFQFLALTLCVAETGVVSAAEPINYERLTHVLSGKEGNGNISKGCRSGKSTKVSRKDHPCCLAERRKTKEQTRSSLAEMLTILCKRNGITPV